MTKFSKTVLIGDLLLSSIYTYADEGPRDYILTIATGNGKVTDFNLASAENSSFNIFDQNYDLVYARESEITNLEISSTISLEGYSSGIYFLEIIENDKATIHRINVEAKKVKNKTIKQCPSLQR
ncbi:putative secreted protein (Por secretion system target) [Flavobacterium sp. 90]|uniref:secretion protein n=1 Tax=unclassified Flavobacterium TaxID=196869 RepID=UPI000EAF8DDE|nr:MULTISPECIES: secretion protein [unclassified Flavobacterium]RKR12016.1 putative secreted protein (Por secretion system target) [Flavobacterium sp. 81]TCK55788.1 putative secreted protein (Por secretion system target) [Flavobacterium sp. 90]